MIAKVRLALTTVLLTVPLSTVAVLFALAGEAIRIPKRDEQVRITVSAGVAC